MNPSPHQSPDADNIAVEAYAWFVRLQSGQATANERAEFERWLQRGEAQRHAYAEAKALWSDETLSAALRQIRPAQRRRVKASFQHKLWPAVAFALALLAINSPRLLLNIQADYHAGPQPQAIELADGSHLMLDADSAIAVDPQNPRHIRLLQGEVYCEVKPDPSHPFLVTGRYSQTQVLGTHFAVRTGADADTVTVAEGKVRLAHGDEAVLLQVGEQASAYADHLSGRAKVAAERLAWVRGSLVFEQIPLAEAVARIQQYRKGWVLWRNPALRDFPVSGRFNLANPDHILDTLTQTLPVKITHVTPWLVVIR